MDGSFPRPAALSVAHGRLEVKGRLEAQALPAVGGVAAIVAPRSTALAAEAAPTAAVYTTPAVARRLDIALSMVLACEAVEWWTVVAADFVERWPSTDGRLAAAAVAVRSEKGTGGALVRAAGVAPTCEGGSALYAARTHARARLT